MVELDPRTVFFENLLILGFDPARPPPYHQDHLLNKHSEVIDKDVFVRGRASVGKVMEAMVWFLFSQLDPQACNERFSGCWPVVDARTQGREFRNITVRWLENLKKEGAFSVLEGVTIRKSHFEDCRGERFERILLALSNYVVQTRVYATQKALPGKINSLNTRRLKSGKLPFQYDLSFLSNALGDVLALHSGGGASVVDRWGSLRKPELELLRQRMEEELSRQLSFNQRLLEKSAANKYVSRRQFECLQAFFDRLSHELEQMCKSQVIRVGSLTQPIFTLMAERDDRALKAQKKWKSIELFCAEMGDVLAPMDEALSLDADSVRDGVFAAAMKSWSQSIRHFRQEVIANPNRATPPPIASPCEAKMHELLSNTEHALKATRLRLETARDCRKAVMKAIEDTKQRIYARMEEKRKSSSGGVWKLDPPPERLNLVTPDVYGAFFGHVSKQAGAKVAMTTPQRASHNNVSPLPGSPRRPKTNEELRAFIRERVAQKLKLVTSPATKASNISSVQAVEENLSSLHLSGINDVGAEPANSQSRKKKRYIEAGLAALAGRAVPSNSGYGPPTVNSSPQGIAKKVKRSHLPMLHSKQQKKEDSQNESTAIAEHAARVMDPETSSNHGFQAKVEIGRSLEQPRRKSVRIIDEVQYIPISEEAPPPSLATRLESDDFVGDDSLYPMELSGDEDILLDEPSTSQDLIFDEEPPQFFGTPIRDGYDSLSPFIMSNHDDETHSENVAGEYVSPFIVPNPGSENACGDDAEVEDGNSVAGNVAEHQEPSESVSPPTSRRGYTFNIEKNDLSIGLLELGTDDEADHDDGYPAVDLGDQSADDILDLANMGTFLEEGSSLFIDKMSMLLEDGVEVEEIEEADGEGDFTLESILKDDEAAENENQSEAAEDKEFRNEAEDDKENQIGTESVETAFGGATPRRSILTSSNPLTARKTGILMTPYKAALLNSAAKAEATRAVKGFQMVGPQAAQTPVRHGQSPLADPFADPAQNQNSSNSALRETQVHNTALTPTRRSALRKSDPNLIPMTPAQSIPPTPQLISFSVARPVARNSVPSDAIAQRRAAKAALALWEGSDPERVEDSVLVTTENPDLSLIFLKSYIEGGMGDGNQDEGDDEDEDVELDLPLFGGNPNAEAIRQRWDMPEV